jgi:hypothetical protein
MGTWRAILMLAASVLLAAAGVADLRAATEDEPGTTAPRKKSTDLKDILVPIPSYSNDVDDNGCHVRRAPEEIFVGPDTDTQHVAFTELIGETIRRYSVRAILDGPEKFMASLAQLDADTRTLVPMSCVVASAAMGCTHSSFSVPANTRRPSAMPCRPPGCSASMAVRAGNGAVRPDLSRRQRDARTQLLLLVARYTAKRLR